MIRKTFLALLAAVTMTAAGPAMLDQQLARANNEQEQLDVAPPAEGKLNYYRVPGGTPNCSDPCSGGVCCTYPA